MIIKKNTSDDWTPTSSPATGELFFPSTDNTGCYTHDLMALIAIFVLLPRITSSHLPPSPVQGPENKHPSQWMAKKTMHFELSLASTVAQDYTLTSKSGNINFTFDTMRPIRAAQSSYFCEVQIYLGKG